MQGSREPVLLKVEEREPVAIAVRLPSHKALLGTKRAHESCATSIPANTAPRGPYSAGRPAAPVGALTCRLRRASPRLSTSAVSAGRKVSETIIAPRMPNSTIAPTPR